MYDYRPAKSSSIHFGPGPEKGFFTATINESLLEKFVREERDRLRKVVEEATREVVEDDDYYEGKNGTEAIDIIEEFDLGFCLGNVVKYVLRSGKKAGNTELDDLEKARWYLDRYIGLLKEEDEDEE